MSQWFAIQLVVSDRPFNMDTMPRLDVFAAYSLYAIQGRLGTNACYALRLGFFGERKLARTLCEDMQALFRFASVVQVSAAERARFEKAPTEEVVPLPNSTQRGAQIVQIDSARRAVTGSPGVPQPKSVAPVKKPASNLRGGKKFKSLSQELMEEARQIQLARSEGMKGKHGAAQTASWFSRLLGR